MGAWIEIRKVIDENLDAQVAPHMGAWIEIMTHRDGPTSYDCRTPHGCVD